MGSRHTQLILIGLLVVVVLGGWVVELPFSMNYLQARSFWLSSLAIGVLVGLVTAVLVLRRYRDQLGDVVAKMLVFFAVFFTLCVCIPLLLSWVNRLGVPAKVAVPTEVMMESQQARFTSRFGNSRLQKPQANQYLFFFYRDGQLYRIQDDKLFFPGAEAGDTLTLDIASGRLGYEWVIRRD